MSERGREMKERKGGLDVEFGEGKGIEMRGKTKGKGDTRTGKRKKGKWREKAN